LGGKGDSLTTLSPVSLQNLLKKYIVKKHSPGIEIDTEVGVAPQSPLKRIWPGNRIQEYHKIKKYRIYKEKPQQQPQSIANHKRSRQGYHIPLFCFDYLRLAVGG
jgi:hypothetical protein